MFEKYTLKRMDSDLSVIIPRAQAISGNDNSFLLHEAARRYDHEYLLALLQEGRASVQTQDSNGRSSLHVLLEDGILTLFPT